MLKHENPNIEIINKKSVGSSVFLDPLHSADQL